MNSCNFLFDQKLTSLSAEKHLDHGSQLNGNVFLKYQNSYIEHFSTIESVSNAYSNKINFEKDLKWRSNWPDAAIRTDWIQHMVDCENPLREKVSLFWNHVVPISVGIWGFAQNLLIDAYRKNAFENYEVLLKEVLSTPCAMKFLNAYGSSKAKPNQNMPRELLELFTVGVDNFSQRDVTEVSRAFTGRRTVNPDNFELPYPYTMYLDQNSVDGDVKRILGNSGDWDGDDAIDLLVNTRATYYRIADKFMRFFISDCPDEKHVVELVENSLLLNRLNIKDLIDYVLKSNWLNSKKYFKSKVKTPVEFWVGLQRLLGIRSYSSELHSYVLREMGQNVFFPPNVGGWPWGNSWLQGNLLKNRLFLPVALLDISQKGLSIDNWGLKEKIEYRLFKPHLLGYRYEYNVVFDFEQFRDTLISKNVDINDWLGIKGVSKIDTYKDLKMAISHPSFQFV